MARNYFSSLLMSRLLHYAVLSSVVGIRAASSSLDTSKHLHPLSSMQTWNRAAFTWICGVSPVFDSTSSISRPFIL